MPLEITSLTLHISPPTAEDTTLHLPYLEHLVLDTCRLFPSATAWDFPTLQSLIIRNCHFNRRSTLVSLHIKLHHHGTEQVVSLSLTVPIASVTTYSFLGDEHQLAPQNIALHLAIDIASIIHLTWIIHQ
jgi:hypothetical protein